ncbi:MAG TPA: amino acid ABC transporter permease [Stellaceae bacterium]|nr:amino acid ABC transporter permease [Stellaceae bacterium]
MIGSGHFAAYLLLLLRGVVVTLELSLGALVIGSVVGILLGAMRSSRRRPLRLAALVYIEALRSTPFVILLFLMYYAMPLALNIDIPPFPAAISALSLHCSAYMAEVVRSGIESVAKGQWEAAAALGLGYRRIMRFVVLPQALPVMIPPTIGVYISTIKESSLASIVGFVELLGQGMAIRESNAGRGTADVLVAVAFGYFAICYSLSRLGRYIEGRSSRDRRAAAVRARPAAAPRWRFARRTLS